MPAKKQTYEEAMNKLEDIANKMENEELSLEERMKYYEQGMKLCETVNVTLKSMEEKITILNGTKEEDF